MCSLSQTAGVGGRQAEAVHSLLPSGLLQSVSGWKIFFVLFLFFVQAIALLTMWEKRPEGGKDLSVQRRKCGFFLCVSLQNLPEDTLAQSQGSVSAQLRKCGLAFLCQRSRVPADLRPPHAAARGLLQVRSHSGVRLVW